LHCDAAAFAQEMLAKLHTKRQELQQLLQTKAELEGKLDRAEQVKARP
jgi:chaperonin cofactor prefoldin